MCWLESRLYPECREKNRLKAGLQRFTIFQISSGCSKGINSRHSQGGPGRLQTTHRFPALNSERQNMIRRFFIACSVVLSTCVGLTCSAKAAEPPPPEPWLAKELEKFQDLKFGFMMHFGAYSQWGCIESWPLVEEDKWARPDDLKAWGDAAKTWPASSGIILPCRRHSIPRSSIRLRGPSPPRTAA